MMATPPPAMAAQLLVKLNVNKIPIVRMTATFARTKSAATVFVHILLIQLPATMAIYAPPTIFAAAVPAAEIS